MKRKLYSILFMVFIFSVTLLSSLKHIKAEDKSSYNQETYRNTSFYRVYNNEINKGTKEYNGSELYFNLSDVIESFEVVNKDSKDYLKINPYNTFSFKVNVSEKALYSIALEYMMFEEYSTFPEVSLKINDKVQFSEMERIPLEVSWDILEREESNKYNRYNDELLPFSVSKYEVIKYYLEDDNESYNKTYKFLLEEGENIISFSSTALPFIVSGLYLGSDIDIISYDEYDKTKESNVNTLITIEAEDFINKNDLQIKQSYYKDPGCTPFDYKTKVLNVLDGSSVSKGGSKVKYSFKADYSGYYYIALKYFNDSNLGVVSSRNIYIDDKIPFEEFDSYLFETSRKWKNEILSNEDGYLKVYIEEGYHTLTIESSLAYQEKYIDELNEIMDKINTISLNVKVITGGETSQIITQNITKYLPTLEEDLLHYSDRLNEIYKELLALDKGSKNSAPEITSLEVAAKQLKKLAKKPNKINSKLEIFSDGSGSCYQLIGDAISSLSLSPLYVDRIYIIGDSYDIKDLPKPKSSFFRKAWISIKSFFYSFIDERYKLSNANANDTLDIWVQQSSLYTDIMQQMMDQAGFSFKTKVNVLPSVSKLVLSHSASDNPDVVLSLDTWEPYAMALRGMLEDLSKYDGFTETIENIESGNFVPLIFEDGVYGIPETTSAYLLYYRKDILDSLNLEVPDTWDDVIEMLYTLQSYSMNFYHPCSADSSYKSFGMVTPFFYQNGAEVFSYDSLTSTLEEESTIKAFNFLTELYTVYNLPQQVSSFFESFRSGTIPVGVAAIDLFLQLQYAAPEISGQWGVSLLPGVYNEDSGKVERWSASYGKCSILFANSDMKEEGYELIKWWNKTETQVEYMRNIKMTLGEKYLVVPANLEALRLSCFDNDMKAKIIEQCQWSMVPAVTPGSYIVEREISQIWNKVVIDKVPLRQAISESIPKINRELKRKLDEFNYIVDDKSTYRVPLSYNIDEWLKR